ncbi:MAG TPA: hypothetical protein VJH68_00845 [Candidatus Nanoarchaeia archaeon]|nr:hypothetical protein [Candidatus Nanoarchaeia archaeon]
MIAENKPKNRDTAKKICLEDINQGNFITEENNELCFVLAKNKEKLSRLCAVGIVVNKETQGSIATFLVDDGTATVNVKLFEEKKETKQIAVGATVLLIAKIRKFNQIRYLAPEIIKIVDPLWLKIHMAVLAEENKKTSSLAEKQETKKNYFIEDKPNLKKTNDKKNVEIAANWAENKFPVEKIVELIKMLDSGGGADLEEVLEKSPLAETEKLIEKMLESGDIFQNLPGKIKVL